MQRVDIIVAGIAAQHEVLAGSLVALVEAQHEKQGTAVSVSDIHERPVVCEAQNIKREVLQVLINRVQLLQCRVLLSLQELGPQHLLVFLIF